MYLLGMFTAPPMPVIGQAIKHLSLAGTAVATITRIDGHI
jgi:hypothetical protein